MERININRIRERSMSDDQLKNITYIDSKLVVINSVNDMIHKRDVVLVEGFLMMLVLKGHAILNIEDDTVHLTEGDAFICTPRNIIENSMTSMDFELQGCFMSSSYAQEILRSMNFNISFYGIRKNHRVAHLNNDEIEAMKAYQTLLMHTLKHPESEIRNFAIDHMMQLCALEFHSIFKLSDEKSKELPISYKSAEQIVNRFAQILNESHPPIHTVSEVAEKLNITPKYFSTICKQVTGHTASEIIIEQLVNTARIMLRNPQMSIKQIAMHMGFNNQSHFGTFMRRYTGKSPQQIRKDYK